jgi:hypothetical protein
VLFVVEFPLKEGGADAALVDIPVGDIAAVAFSLINAFAAVTLFASSVAFIPVAFVPVALLAVVVVPFVVVGIIVFPIIVLLDMVLLVVDDNCSGGDVTTDGCCCANTSHGLITIDTTMIPKGRIANKDTIVVLVDTVSFIV